MGTVIELDNRRAVRERADDARSRHPVLRWVAGDAFWVAHRKDTNGAACGAAGDLMLSPPGVPLCVTCWPLPDREPVE